MITNLPFLHLAALIIAVLALTEAFWLLHHRKRTGTVEGAIADIWQPINQASKKNNSKWALVNYPLDGLLYTSENRVQVPLHSNVGDSLKVHYRLDRPQVLYQLSWRRFLGLALAALTCYILGLLAL